MTKAKRKRIRLGGVAHKPADDHEFKQPEFARKQVTASREYQRAYNRWLTDSVAIERAILKSRGW